jgi:hypothetical protein
MLKKFAFHQPSTDGIVRANKIREAYSALTAVLDEVLPPKDGRPHSREAAVAHTELETSAMWAIKASVLNDPESKPSL